MKPKHEDHKTDSRSKNIERPSVSTFVKQQLRKINWTTFLSFLVVVVASIQVYFLRQSNEITRDALMENQRQFSDTLQEMREQTAAAKDAAGAAQDAATAASRSAEAASRQVAAAQEQINVDIDALRLDQRPWLGYRSHTIESRANDTSKWEKRDPKSGEQFRVRLYVQNVGKTPALNVRLMSTQSVLIREGLRPSDPKKEQWQRVSGKYVVFPDDDRLSHITPTIPMPSTTFSTYSNRTGELFFWARLQYCDTTGQHHWTQIGLARLFKARASEFSIRASSVSPDPGEANHPDCQN